MPVADTALPGVPFAYHAAVAVCFHYNLPTLSLLAFTIAWLYSAFSPLHFPHLATGWTSVFMPLLLLFLAIAAFFAHCYTQRRRCIAQYRFAVTATPATRHRLSAATLGGRRCRALYHTAFLLNCAATVLFFCHALQRFLFRGCITPCLPSLRLLYLGRYCAAGSAATCTRAKLRRTATAPPHCLSCHLYAAFALHGCSPRATATSLGGFFDYLVDPALFAGSFGDACCTPHTSARAVVWDMRTS